jgi:hypothetical protein
MFGRACAAMTRAASAREGNVSMMIPQTLTAEASQHSVPVRSYRGPLHRGTARLVWCVMSLCAGALACTGSIDTTEQPPLSGSAGAGNGAVTTGNAPPGTATGTTPRAPRPTGVAASEDNDDVQGVDSEASSRRRGGGGGRARAARDDDAGADQDVDAGELVADAGELDAGVLVDAGRDADAAAL